MGIRARCPSLYKHAASVISRMGRESQGDGGVMDDGGDGVSDTAGGGKSPAVSVWRVYAPAGVPIVRNNE